MHKEIRNIEEKRLQIAYFLSRKKGGVSKFKISSIYRQWCQWWKEDFCVDGQQLKMYANKTVISYQGAKHGEPQPDYCQYYTQILRDVQNKIKEEYHSNLTGRQNSDIFLNKLLNHRKNNGKILRKKLKQNNLNTRYYLVNKRYDKYICKLGRYILHDSRESKDKYCCIGSYEDVLQYIDENLIV